MPLPTLRIPTSSGDGHADALHEAAEAARDVAEHVAKNAAERAATQDRPGGFPAADIDTLREVGLLAAPLPAEFGGMGLGTAPGSMHALLTVLRTIGRGSLPLGRLYEGHVNALLLIDEFGTPAQYERWAADAHDGHLFGVWNTEAPSDGVRYTVEGERVRVDGAKTFASGCAHVTRALVPGALVDGWQMAVLPLDTMDLIVEPEWWRASGMQASQSGRVDFTDATVEAEALLGAPGDYLREPAFTGGSIRFAAVQLGGAEALAEAARTHLVRLGRTEHPTHQARFGQIATALETGALWLLGASRLMDPPVGRADPGAVRAYVQMARTAVERVCLDVLEWTDRTVGARGLGTPGATERVGRDLRLYLRQPDPDGAAEAAGAYALDHTFRALGSDL